MKKIFLTGGAGYIGDAAVDYLLKLNCRVTVYDNLMYGGAYMRQHDNLSFVRGDIRDTQRVREQIAAHDSVLHLAALVGDGACAANPNVTIDINQNATRDIASACIDFNKMLVFASTCSVYGKNNNLLDEDSQTNPLSVYAHTKLTAESYVKEVPNHYIFRLGTLFGLGAEHSRLRCDLVVNILTYKACTGEPLTVFGGEQWRPLLHVRDASELMGMATAGQSNNKPGTYILYCGNYTISEIAEQIGYRCGVSDKIVKTNIQFEDMRNYRISSRCRGRWFIPARSLAHGISEMSSVMKEGRIANVWDSRFHNAKYISELK